MQNKKVLIVFGTRPEAIKMCPLVNELKKHPDKFNTEVCVTGQHKEMLEQVLNTFRINPDYNLDIMTKNQSLCDITSRILAGVYEILEQNKPDIVLVHGDTTTSFASALAAFYHQIKIGHVEAGLRTYNLHAPFPEEFNRQAVDIISNYYFAPTEKSKQNLINEHISNCNIWVTGNTGIDALRTTVDRNYMDENLKWIANSKFILITAHRRENLGKPMHNMFRAIRQVLEQYPNIKAIYPIHMNPQVRQIAKEELKGVDNIRIIEPLEVFAFHNYIAQSYLVLTDSGGIQEEAPYLGKPVLVMRDVTERPEGVEAGTLKLIGTNANNIYNAIVELIENEEVYRSMACASNPFGDGHASERIVQILEKVAQ